MAASYEEQARALIEGGVDVLLIETCQDLLQAKAALAGVFDAMKAAGQAPAGHGAGDHRIHRHHAARHRDRRRAHRARALRHRRHRHELRHRAARDERCRPPPGCQFAEARLGTTQCRAATERQRARRVPAQARGAGRVSQALHHRVRGAHRGRLLRHHARAPEGGGRCLRESRTRAPRGEAQRGRVKRVYVGSTRPRSQAADRGRGDEHHHARGAFPEPGAGREVRRHPHLG